MYKVVMGHVQGFTKTAIRPLVDALSSPALQAKFDSHATTSLLEWEKIVSHFCATCSLSV